MATDSVRTEVDFLQIDKFSRTPIYEQVIDGIEREILTGELKPNSPVASVRALSVQFSVNPNTLQKAYTFVTAFPAAGGSFRRTQCSDCTKHAANFLTK